MLLINPKSNNTRKFRAIEPPIWCALLAKDGDSIIDNEIQPLLPATEPLIVVMGHTPSVSSTPKMSETYRLMKIYPDAKITGLHPIATGEATYPIPPPSELVKIKRAKWELLDMSKYLAHNWHCLAHIDHRDKYAALYTSYGCPFDCDFCNVHTIYGGRKVYYRNPLDVINEIEYLIKHYDTRNLKFCDELFTLSPHHVSQICEGLEGLKLNIWAYARVDMVTPAMLMKMKRGGVNWLAYGFESADPDILKGIGKNYEGVMETVKMTRDAGIHIMGNFIFGLPNDTLDSMKRTLGLAQRINCEYVNFYCAMPYPGSRLYKGNVKDWDRYNQHGKLAVPSWIKDFRDYAFKVYFTDAQYLSSIEHKFGIKAVEHIKEMLNV